jgi:hypothetical protein
LTLRRRIWKFRRKIPESAQTGNKNRIKDVLVIHYPIEFITHDRARWYPLSYNPES